MSAGAWRCFVALPVPPLAASWVELALAPLREHRDTPRWVPPQHFHVTLLFLGAVAPGEVADVGEAMRLVATRHDAIELAIGGASGLLRSGDDGVAWLTMRTGHERIVRLAEDLHRQLRESGTFHPVLREPSKRWRPHLTVARRASSALISALQAISLPAEPIAWRAESVVLFRSHLGPPGARYEPIAVAPLGRLTA